MTKMFQKFEFPAWSCQIFTKEIKIPENQIRHHFRIHLGNPLCILLLIILGLQVRPHRGCCRCHGGEMFECKLSCLPAYYQLLAKRPKVKSIFCEKKV